MNFIRVNSVSLIIVFISCFILSFFGGALWLKYLQEEAKDDVEQLVLTNFDNEALIHLSFTLEDAKKLKWEHEKEFEYKNKMYDVVRTTYQQGMIHYWCWMDEKESQINDTLEQLICQMLGVNEEDNERHEQLLKLYSSLYCQGSNSMLFGSYWTASNEETLAPPSHFKSLHLPPPFPPPNFN